MTAMTNRTGQCSFCRLCSPLPFFPSLLLRGVARASRSMVAFLPLSSPALCGARFPFHDHQSSPFFPSHDISHLLSGAHFTFHDIRSLPFFPSLLQRCVVRASRSMIISPRLSFPLFSCEVHASRSMTISLRFSFPLFSRVVWRALPVQW